MNVPKSRKVFQFFKKKNRKSNTCNFLRLIYRRVLVSAIHRQRPSRSFELESRNVASQPQNRSDRRLCLNRFKLCDRFASGRIIAASKSLGSFEQCFFGVFGNSSFELIRIYFEFFSTTDVILMLSFEQVVTGRWWLYYDQFSATGTLV